MTVVVITTSTRLAALPGNVRVPQDAGLLATDSVIDVTQIATIDRGALERRAGLVPDWLVAQVDDGLRRALAL